MSENKKDDKKELIFKKIITTFYTTIKSYTEDIDVGDLEKTLEKLTLMNKILKINNKLTRNITKLENNKKEKNEPFFNLDPLCNMFLINRMRDKNTSDYRLIKNIMTDLFKKTNT